MCVCVCVCVCVWVWVYTHTHIYNTYIFDSQIVMLACTYFTYSRHIHNLYKYVLLILHREHLISLPPISHIKCLCL